VAYGYVTKDPAPAETGHAARTRRVRQPGEGRVQAALDYSQTLATVYEHKKRLQVLWQTRFTSQDGLLHHLQEWCKQAEETGIKVLQDFARSLHGYTLQAA
jgi:hypothetical protein